MKIFAFLAVLLVFASIISGCATMNTAYEKSVDPRDPKTMYPLKFVREIVKPGAEDRQRMEEQFNIALMGHWLPRQKFGSTLVPVKFVPYHELKTFYDNWGERTLVYKTKRGSQKEVKTALPYINVSFNDFARNWNGTLSFIDRYGNLESPNCWGWFPGNTRDVHSALRQYRRVVRKSAIIKQEKIKWGNTESFPVVTSSPPASRNINLDEPRTAFMYLIWYEFFSDGYKSEKAAQIAYDYYQTYHNLNFDFCSVPLDVK